MPDITKCAKGCENQAQCYRWTSEGSQYQSYSDFKPDASGECEHFWDNTGRNGWSKRA